MQLANSMVEDPYQTRLEEFVDPNEGPKSLSSFEERSRAMQTGGARRELALQNTGDMSKIGPTFPYYPGLETLFPEPQPEPKSLNEKIEDRRRKRLLDQYTTTTPPSKNDGGPAPAA